MVPDSWKKKATQLYNRFENSRMQSIFEQLTSFDDMLKIFRELVEQAENEADSGNGLYTNFKRN